jgi:predicted CoA-binding protein
MGKKEKVAILGASDDPQRYSYKAFKMLQEYGHEPILVNPSLTSIEGLDVKKSLLEIGVKADTLTMYVNARISSSLEKEILALHPGRVIFNPGAENPALAEKLQDAGIEVEEACTLVLLRTDQF